MDGIVGFKHEKVIDQSSALVNSLGANPASSGAQLIATDLRHQSLQQTNKPPFRKGPQYLGCAYRPIVAGEAPSAAVDEHLQQILNGYIEPAVTVAPQSRHSIGTT